MTKCSRKITGKKIETSNQIEEYIAQYQQQRQISILNVSGLRSVGLDTFNVNLTNKKNLTEFLAFVIHYGYSILDGLIRCCHYPTRFKTVTDVVPKSLFVPIFNYYEIFDLLKDSRYKKEMIHALTRNLS
jgi:hypothetical protein